MKRLLRILLALGVVSLLVVGAFTAANHFGAKLIARKGSTWLQDRGVPVRVGDVSVEVTGRKVEIAVTDLCLFDDFEHDASSLGCASRIEVRARLRASYRNPLSVFEVKFVDVAIDLSQPGSIERLRDLSNGRRAQGHTPGVAADRGPTTRPTLPEDLPALIVEQLHISMPPGGFVDELEVRDFRLTRSTDENEGPPGGLTWLSSIGIRTSPTGFPAALTSLFAHDLAVSGSVSKSLDWDVLVRSMDDEPIQLDVSELGDGATLELAEIELDSARRITVITPKLSVPGVAGMKVEATRLMLELREWTTNVEDLYFARLHLSEFNIDLDVGSGTLTEALGQLAAGPSTPSTADVDSEQTGTASEVDVPKASEQGPWSRRRWYEKVPQQIEISTGRFELGFTFDDENRSPGTLLIDGIDLRYALRAIRTQADLTANANVALTGLSAGSAEVDLAWDWATATLALDTTVRNLEIGAFTAVSPELRSIAPVGSLGLEIAYRDRANGDVEQLEGSFVLGGFNAALSPFSEGLELEHIAWHWDARTRDVDGESALVFERGAAEVGTTHLNFTPTLYGFDIDSPTLFERGDIALEVPTVRADQWFFSAPASLFGPTRDAEMEGDWGMLLRFPIAWTAPDEETGRRGLDIGAPTEFRIDDDNLHLVSLPESVDVRRLNTGMTFTFTGPPGTAARTLGIPAPNDPEAVRQVPQGWVELEDISYYLVAALLYREDGRFFRNHGINWYQWRAVIEQAWEERAFGRGASTVSMQLVKNVFLSHERSVERKLQELFLTYWMTRLVPKDRILETYFNVIEWGPGVNGIVEAARYYFDTTPDRLSLAESVWLASAVPAPARRARQRALGEPPEWSVRHSRDVMRGMESSGWITEAELEVGMRERVRFSGGRGRLVDNVLEGARPLGEDESTAQDPADSADFENAADGEVAVGAALDSGADDSPSRAGVVLSASPRERLLQLIERQLETRP